MTALTVALGALGVAMALATFALIETIVGSNGVDA